MYQSEQFKDKDMPLDFDRSVRTCIVSRGFLYNYYNFVPSAGPLNHTLLLLHGHGDFSYGWRTVIPELLASGIRCVVPDLLGFGQTSKPLDVECYKLKPMSNDMAELLEHAGVGGEKVIVVGHDWGSQLASRLVLHHATLFAACVSITGTYIPPMPQPLTLKEFTDIFPNFSYWHFFTSDRIHKLLRTRMPIFWNATIRTGSELIIPMSEIEARVSADDALAHEHWRVRPILWDEDTYTRYQQNYLRGGWEAPMNWYRAFLLNFDDEKQFLADPRIQIPFLTILAENDPAVPIEIAEASNSLLLKGKMVTMPCGHWVGQEDGPGLGRIITDWLESLGSTACASW
ncbi:hypothetical protein LTR84_006341 [Exophiala bonariae]|uniref:AB hydrolase-1 domain-containing protein n=1 Tax=Exophiala bonariae TaxID=1690606 RepID=A0AAV9N259_9EURO|nr:hypothetical protein LTR84_006341 [Exophiala bonariae]